MMEQHPIPQQISSYEFKLVGEMTLKQFLKAAAGIIIAIIINATGMVVIFKWPLMFFFGGLGLLLAFVPFEDRPLETWIMSFLKSIYSPTVYVYKKKNEGNWLELNKITTEEALEEKKNESQSNLFVSIKKEKTKTSQVKTMTDNSGLGVRTQKVKTVETSDKFEEENTVLTETNKIAEGEDVGKNNQSEDIIEERVVGTEKVDLGLKREKLEATGQAVFGSIPMPDRPDIANVVVGMATSSDGKIIDGVIVEIQDSHGNPVRVIKTNALGQFKISTPLADGRYLLIAERDGYTFDRVNIDLAGKIVDPIRIIAHN